MARILVLYATVEGQTARIAGRIAERLRDARHAVEVRDASASADPAGHDAVIVGASVHYGRHPAWLRAALHRQSDALSRRHGAFFSVCLSGDAAYGRRFLSRVGWQPALTATFAGALRYRQYGWFKRALLRAFARAGGHDSDASRDYEYTDWDAVARFADAFAAALPRA